MIVHLENIARKDLQDLQDTVIQATFVSVERALQLHLVLFHLILMIQVTADLALLAIIVLMAQVIQENVCLELIRMKQANLRANPALKATTAQLLDLAHQQELVPQDFIVLEVLSMRSHMTILLVESVPQVITVF